MNNIFLDTNSGITANQIQISEYFPDWNTYYWCYMCEGHQANAKRLLTMRLDDVLLFTTAICEAHSVEIRKLAKEHGVAIVPAIRSIV